VVNCHRPCRVAGRQEDQLTSARARPLAPIRVGVTVTFTPTASGSRHAVLWIAESGGGPLVDFGIFVLGISLEYLRSLSFELQEGSFLGMQDHLNPPHGGQLINLIATPERTAQLQADSRKWPSWDLTPRQLCDLELLLNGGFSPLRGFISCADYESTCARMRLADGKIWPIPIVLDVADDFASSIGAGTSIALRDPEGVMLAALHVEEVWKPDRTAEARAVYGTTSSHHPGVQHLTEQTHPWYVGGKLEGLHLPHHYDFRGLRLSPSDLRAEFIRLDSKGS